jgi:hypothetical protein
MYAYFKTLFRKDVYFTSEPPWLAVESSQGYSINLYSAGKFNPQKANKWIRHYPKTKNNLSEIGYCLK